MIYVVIEYSQEGDCCASWNEMQGVKLFKTQPAAEQYMLSQGAKKPKKKGDDWVKAGLYANFFNLEEVEPLD